MEKSLVVFSGGQDSTTCLLWALKTYDEVETITFAYGQRHKEEVNCAKKIATELGVKQKVVELDFISQLTENALTREDVEIKNGDIPNTYVEGRNHLFLSVAAIYAETKGIKHIVTGVSETEYSGYPDCREQFVLSLNETLNLAMDTNIDLVTPLMWKNKRDVWEMADQMGRLDFVRHSTLTCYNGIIGDGCHHCPACQLRNDGLKTYLNERNEQ